MSGVSRVFIRDLELAAHIGIHGHEQGRAQPVRINIELDVKGADAEDRLENVVDYSGVAEKIRALVETGHIKLVETLAERIIAAVFLDPRILKIRVRVEKLRALAGAAGAGIEIERSR